VKSLKLVVGAPTVLCAIILAGPASCNTSPKHDHVADDPAAVEQTTRDHSPQHHAAGEQPGHDHTVHPATSHKSAAAATAPTAQNYTDAITQLQARMSSLDAILKSRDYDRVHDDCVAIGHLGESLGSLSAAQGSPVPKEKVAEVTSAGEQLSSAARSLHKAAHNDELAQVKADYARMSKLVESLGRHVPRS